MWEASVTSKGVETTRLGVISPNKGATTQALFSTVAPDGVSFAFTDLGPLPRIGGSIEPALQSVGLPRMDEAAAFLASLECDAVCMNGSIVGFLEGPDYHEELETRLAAATGLPATTNSTGIRDALDDLDVQRLVVVTSYDPTTLGVATDALEALGYDLEVSTLDRRSRGADAIQLSTDRVFRLARRAALEADDPDCVLMLGGAVPSLALVDDLEYELDIPVVSDGQAALYAMFRLAGVGPVEGWGRLLRMV